MYLRKKKSIYNLGPLKIKTSYIEVIFVIATSSVNVACNILVSTRCSMRKLKKKKENGFVAITNPGQVTISSCLISTYHLASH